eukprot:3720139-Amphidinium_carterae.1
MDMIACRDQGWKTERLLPSLSEEWLCKHSTSRRPNEVDCHKQGRPRGQNKTLDPELQQPSSPEKYLDTITTSELHMAVCSCSQYAFFAPCLTAVGVDATDG